MTPCELQETPDRLPRPVTKRRQSNVGRDRCTGLDMATWATNSGNTSKRGGRVREQWRPQERRSDDGGLDSAGRSACAEARSLRWGLGQGRDVSDVDAGARRS